MDFEGTMRMIRAMHLTKSQHSRQASPGGALLQYGGILVCKQTCQEARARHCHDQSGSDSQWE
eukprot:1162018-Pelagomonas_calceolata.AAC.9